MQASPQASSIVPNDVGATGRSGFFPPDVIAAAQASHAKWKIPASVTLAQWAWESGWGRHMPAGSNNPFGIKAVKGQPQVEASTREVVQGRSVTVSQPFRKFASLTRRSINTDSYLPLETLGARTQSTSRMPLPTP